MTVKFRIHLSLAAFHLNNFAALDWRRKFGLPDGTEAAAAHHWQSFDVPETFARTWFGGKMDVYADADPSWLIPGEIVGMHDQATIFRIAPTLTAERAMELFIRARFAAVEAELATANDRLRGLDSADIRESA
jgi:hypothetical protein